MLIFCPCLTFPDVNILHDRYTFAHSMLELSKRLIHRTDSVNMSTFQLVFRHTNLKVNLMRSKPCEMPQQFSRFNMIQVNLIYGMVSHLITHLDMEFIIRINHLLLKIPYFVGLCLELPITQYVILMIFHYITTFSVGLAISLIVSYMCVCVCARVRPCVCVCAFVNIF